MNNARKCVADWLRYCYSDGAQLPTRAVLTELLTEFSAQEDRALRGSSVELVKHLALLACQQKRHQINIGSNLLTQVKIAQLAGKTDSAWNKRWSCRWERLLRILETFDQEGLNHVYKCGRGQKTTQKHSDLLVQHSLQPRTRNEMATGMAL